MTLDDVHIPRVCVYPVILFRGEIQSRLFFECFFFLLRFSLVLFSNVFFSFCLQPARRHYGTVPDRYQGERVTRLLRDELEGGYDGAVSAAERAADFSVQELFSTCDSSALSKWLERTSGDDVGAFAKKTRENIKATVPPREAGAGAGGGVVSIVGAAVAAQQTQTLKLVRMEYLLKDVVADHGGNSTYAHNSESRAFRALDTALPCSLGYLLDPAAASDADVVRLC